MKVQKGFAMVTILGIMVVLSILGAMVYRNVITGITHSGKDARRVRAEFAAESAVQWALAELSRPRQGNLPYTLATNNPDGITPMAKEADKYLPEQEGDTRKFAQSDLAEFPHAQMGVNDDGWMYKSTNSPEIGISGGSKENLAFKVWYPNDTTLRITGRANVDGVSAELDLVGILKEVAVTF